MTSINSSNIQLSISFPSSAGTPTSSATSATTANALTTEEFADVLQILQTLEDQPRPSSSLTSSYIDICARCNKIHYINELVYPDKLGVYFPYRTCLHCLAKRCIPDSDTFNQMKKDFNYLYSIPNHMQHIVHKHHEILYKIYHHPKTPLKSLHLQPKNTKIYRYDITLLTED